MLSDALGRVGDFHLTAEVSQGLSQAVGLILGEHTQHAGTPSHQVPALPEIQDGALTEGLDDQRKVHNLRRGDEPDLPVGHLRIQAQLDDTSAISVLGRGRTLALHVLVEIVDPIVHVDQLLGAEAIVTVEREALRQQEDSRLLHDLELLRPTVGTDQLDERHRLVVRLLVANTVQVTQEAVRAPHRDAVDLLGPPDHVKDGLPSGLHLVPIHQGLDLLFAQLVVTGHLSNS